MKLISPQFQKFLERFSFRHLTLAWYRYFKLLFTILFFGVVGLGGYLWYVSLYCYTWDESKRQTYMEQTFKETNLKEKEFSQLLETLKVRVAEHQNPLTISRNLFTGEPAVNQ
jgi:hypothetical protein